MLAGRSTAVKTMIAVAALCGSMAITGAASTGPDPYPPIPSDKLRSNCTVEAVAGLSSGSRITCSNLAIPQKEFRATVTCNSEKKSKIYGL